MAVESIHKRIRRLRESKGLSQEALADEAGVKYQSVQEWEREDGTAPSRKRQAKVARALGVTPAELMTGAPDLPKDPDTGQPLSLREELMLELFRSLFSHQQLRLIQNLRALKHANDVVRKEMGGKPLRGVSDADVRAAFKDVPAPTLTAALKRPARPGRDMGDAMGDYLDD